MRGVTPATVSHHLKILSEAGLIACRREGQFVYSEAVPETIAAYTQGARENRRRQESGAPPLNRANPFAGLLNAKKSLLLACLLLCAGRVFAQSPDKDRDKDKDPAAILELGGAAGVSLLDGEPGFGPTVAVEITPIENWLEIEAGVTPLFGHHSTEWDADLLFKKPWTLSKKTEFMAGIGPEWIHTRATERDHEFHGRGSHRRLHVLAFGEAHLRLVSRTKLRLQLRAEATSNRWASAAAC